MEENRKAHGPRQLAGVINVALVWSQCSECGELRVVRKWLVIRCWGMSLRNRDYVQGESALWRTLWMVDQVSLTCEGGVDVVGVVTPLRGGAQVVLHGDQVVELSALLGVHEKGEVKEDGEGQVEVEREEGEVKEKRTWMTMRMR